MRIIVCLKEVSDPEASHTQFSVNPQAAQVVPSDDVPRVVSLYDEHALEAAIQLKERVGGEVLVVSLGPPSAEALLRRGLAVGADQGILLADPLFEGLESFGTAYVLSRAIQRIGEFQLIVCGLQSADRGAGIVGPALAHLLGIVSVTAVRGMEVQGDRLMLERNIQGDELIECSLPALLTVGSEINKPRYPALKAFMEARRKEIARWTGADIGVDGAQLEEYARLVEPVGAFILRPSRRSWIIEEDTPAQAGAALATKLRADRVL